MIKVFISDTRTRAGGVPGHPMVAAQCCTTPSDGHIHLIKRSTPEIQ